MYQCQVCKKVVPPRTKAHRLVIETRPRKYPPKKDAFRVLRDGKVKWIDDPGGQGQEIVREVTACPDCAAQFKPT